MASPSTAKEISSSPILFYWGTNPDAWPQFAGAPAGETGTTPVNVSLSVDGLQPRTTYYFQVWAENAIGWASGSILKFTTP
jgi:hypothetical protein